ncbi:MAG: hypothetical protein ACOYZ8_10695 [Chloroflexota bacterium]
MTRKRGGQPNNKNAYKHGFYSKHFSNFESGALSEIPITDVSGEIDTLRVAIERVMESYTASLKDMGIEKRLACLNGLAAAAGSIGGLTRIQAAVNKNAKEVSELEERFMNIGEDMVEESEEIQE